MKRGLLLLPFLLLACTADHSVAPGDATSDIQGGSPEAGYRTVGLLDTGCTGTLITPTIVLTAGHCVARPVRKFYLWDGKASRAVSAVESRAFPGYSALSAHTCPSTVRDLGIVHLAEPISDIAPTGLSGVPETGTMCFAVGYGTHNDDAGVAHNSQRYSAWETIAGFGDHTTIVTWGSGIADHGDSGGPLISNNQLVGTVSCQTAPFPSPSRLVHYERVDQPEAATWIQSVIAEWSVAPAAGADPDAGTGDASAPSL